MSAPKLRLTENSSRHRLLWHVSVVAAGATVACGQVEPKQGYCEVCIVHVVSRVSCAASGAWGGHPGVERWSFLLFVTGCGAHSLGGQPGQTAEHINCIAYFRAAQHCKINSKPRAAAPCCPALLLLQPRSAQVLPHY